MKNCGGCGTLCTEKGSVCSDGSCTCPSSQVVCGGACVDTGGDAANCGACGVTCKGAEQCIGAQCGCAPPATVCSGVCRNLYTDANNCGGCGVACGANEICTTGKCQKCPMGRVACNGVCTDLQYDAKSCGTCGHACATGEVCIASKCQVAPPECGRFDGTTGTSWEVRALRPGGWASFSDYTPFGGTGFYSLGVNDLYWYDTASNTWTARAYPPLLEGYYTGPAFVGNELHVLQGGAAQRYDIAGNAWSKPFTGLPSTSSSPSTHDNAGRIHAVTTTNQLAIYDPGTNTVAYRSLALVGPLSEPRLAWDSCAAKIYLAPRWDGGVFWSYDPATGALVKLATQPTGAMNDVFCGDRSGHIYAAGGGNSLGFWQYTIATNAWKAIPSTPFNHGSSGSCTVANDGYLYFTPGGGPMARIKLN